VGDFDTSPWYWYKSFISIWGLISKWPIYIEFIFYTGVQKKWPMHKICPTDFRTLVCCCVNISTSAHTFSMITMWYDPESDVRLWNHYQFILDIREFWILAWQSPSFTCQLLIARMDRTGVIATGAVSCWEKTFVFAWFDLKADTSTCRWATPGTSWRHMKRVTHLEMDVTDGTAPGVDPSVLLGQIVWYYLSDGQAANLAFDQQFMNARYCEHQIMRLMEFSSTESSDQTIDTTSRLGI
jgi:hypothetical protein